MYRWLKENKDTLEEERSLPTIDPTIDSNYEVVEVTAFTNVSDPVEIHEPEETVTPFVDVSDEVKLLQSEESPSGSSHHSRQSSLQDEKQPAHIAVDIIPEEEKDKTVPLATKEEPLQLAQVEVIPMVHRSMKSEDQNEPSPTPPEITPLDDTEEQKAGERERVSFSDHDVVINVDEEGHATIEEREVAMNTTEISTNIEWFRERLENKAGAKHYVTPADLKKLVEEEPSEFAEKIFDLVDTDKSGSISQQELIGGLSRLTVKEKKKTMKWFEKIFISTSGEDQLLQLDEFEKALCTSGFVEKLFQLMDHAGTGKLPVPQILDALGKLPCEGKDANWLSWFENQFSDIAGEDRQIDFDEFKSALQLSKSSFFVERFFTIFDDDKSGTISLSEMMAALTLLLQGSQIEKLNFLFKVYDVDGNGTIDYDELKTVLKSCMDESALTFSEENLEELATALFQDADTDQSGSVSFEELQAELQKYPDIIENLTISAASWLKPQRRPKKKSLSERLPTWLSWKHVKNNWTYFMFLGVFAVINLGLFLQAAIRYRDGGVFLALARGGGACLNFNPVLVLMLMFRQLITMLRSTPVAFLFPVDKYIKLHKIVGYTILFFTIEHFLAHLANLSYYEIDDSVNPSCNHSMWFCLIGVDTGLGWVGGTAGLTGVLLMIILIIMVVCSLPIVRNKGAFEIFFFSHNLFFLFYIILILHGPDFWKWFIVPALIYIGERIFRSKIIKFIRYGRTYIQQANVLSSRVTHLSITRPSNFNFQPGDYVFIQIPAIAKYEWHPFTISSAPEMKDYFWLHVRGVGSWTNKLYDYFDEKLKSSKQLKREGTIIGGKKAFSIDSEEPRRMTRSPSLPHNTMVRSRAYLKSFFGKDTDKRLRVHIDGPYGTPSVHIFQAEHAVLIGSGIGVTPYASILQSIVKRFNSTRQTCPNCEHSWTGSLPPTVMKLKKVDFFWINRHQKHFEWFVNLLSDLEVEQNDEGAAMERFLDMHMYITSALQKTDVKAVMLQMALDLIHKEKKVDLITGLKTRTQPGRPNWDKVFKELKESRRGQVTVFFCGSPVLARVLSLKCDEFGFRFRKENF